MGEYAKTYQRLKELRAKKKAIEEQIEARQEKLAEVKEEIADLEGYLLELDFIDNGSRGARGL
jgi:prefoldin subunit 5